MEVIIPVGVPYSQIIEDVRAVFRHEVQQALASIVGVNPSPVADVPLSIRESATLLGVTVQTIHEWKRRGWLKFHKLGSRSYIKRADLMAALHGQQRTMKPGK